MILKLGDSYNCEIGGFGALILMGSFENNEGVKIVKSVGVFLSKKLTTWDTCDQLSTLTNSSIQNEKDINN